MPQSCAFSLQLSALRFNLGFRLIPVLGARYMVQGGVLKKKSHDTVYPMPYTLYRNYWLLGSMNMVCGLFNNTVFEVVTSPYRNRVP